MSVFESDEERKIRERAEAKQRHYEADTGEKVQDEPGIENDYTLEELAMTAMGGGGMASKAGRMAANEAKGVLKKGILNRLKDKGVPESGTVGGMGYGSVNSKPLPQPPRKSLFNEDGARMATGRGEYVQGAGIKIRE